MADQTEAPDVPAPTAPDHLHNFANVLTVAAVHAHNAADSLVSEAPHPDGDDDGGLTPAMKGQAANEGTRATPAVSAQARGMAAVRGNPTTARVFRAATGRRG